MKSVDLMFLCLCSDPGPEDDFKKKTRRNRTTFSNTQLAALEKVSNMSVYESMVFTIKKGYQYLGFILYIHYLRSLTYFFNPNYRGGGGGVNIAMRRKNLILS